MARSVVEGARRPRAREVRLHPPHHEGRRDRTGSKLLVLALLFACAALTSAQEPDDIWEPVTGAETLRQFMSGLKAERTLPGGGLSRGEYNAHGTGVLHSPGESFPHTWRI